MKKNRKLNDYLLLSIEIGNVECVKHCIESGADVHVDDDAALEWVSMNGHCDVVKLLGSYAKK